MMMVKCAFAAVTLAALSAPPARAVIVTGDQGRNLTAPTGDLAGSGWDLQGEYGAFSGTPISSTWFITARHFGDAGPTIALGDGVHRLTGATQIIPGTDLVLRQVADPFSAFASIFNPALDGKLTASDRLVVFGRGTARGAAIAGKGFAWGESDAARSWGTNTFGGRVVLDADDVVNSSFAAGASFIVADFDNNGDPDEATLSNGDSGGGVFVRRDGVWKLAAINYGVDLFRTAAKGDDLPAAVYDGRGLYGQTSDGSYAYIDPATNPQPVTQYWYASDVPASLGLLTATPLVVPEPATLGVLAVGGLLLGRRRRLLD